jgi:hypothetical protein
MHQEQLVLVDVLRPESIRRGVKMLGEVGHTTDICTLCMGRVVSQLQLFEHLYDVVRSLRLSFQVANDRSIEKGIAWRGVPDSDPEDEL